MGCSMRCREVKQCDEVYPAAVYDENGRVRNTVGRRPAGTVVGKRATGKSSAARGVARRMAGLDGESIAKQYFTLLS